MSQIAGSNNSYKPITNTAWVRARLCKLQKRCTRLATASNKVYQLLSHGLWFSPGTPASSTTKTGRHDIAEILLKVALKHQKSINQNLYITCCRKTHAIIPYMKTKYQDLENTLKIQLKPLSFQYIHLRYRYQQ